MKAQPETNQARINSLSEDDWINGPSEAVNSVAHLTLFRSVPSAQPNTGLPRVKCKCRGLLAFDGKDLSSSFLRRVQTRCIQLLDRVDILLVNPPKAPTTRLYSLLISLEQSGMDYRLTIMNGNMSELVTNYLKRFLGIKLIILAALPQLDFSLSKKIFNLGYQGYCLVPLSITDKDSG